MSRIQKSHNVDASWTHIILYIRQGAYAWSYSHQGACAWSSCVYYTIWLFCIYSIRLVASSPSSRLLGRSAAWRVLGRWRSWSPLQTKMLASCRRCPTASWRTRALGTWPTSSRVFAVIHNNTSWCISSRTWRYSYSCTAPIYISYLLCNLTLTFSYHITCIVHLVACMIHLDNCAMCSISLQAGAGIWHELENSAPGGSARRLLGCRHRLRDGGARMTL